MLRVLVAPLVVLALAASATALPLGVEAPAPLAEPLAAAVATTDDVASLALAVAPDPVAEEASALVATVEDAATPTRVDASSPSFPRDAPEEDAPARASREPRRAPDEDPGFLGLLPVLPSLPPVPPAVPLDVVGILPAPPRVLDADAPAPAPPAPPARAPAPAATLPAPASVPAAIVVAGLAATAAAPGLAFAWERLRRWGFLAVLYARIAKERLLDHTARERLLEGVRQRPGAPLADLARDAGIPRNTAVYHLGRLEKEGLVSSVRQGRVRLYFAPGALADRENADAFAALRHPTTRAVAAHIGRAPGLDQRALCEQTGLTPSLAHWHASRLADAGVVERQREGRRVRYYPGPAMRLLG